jgi:hypothetical protein
VVEGRSSTFRLPRIWCKIQDAPLVAQYDLVGPHDLVLPPVLPGLQREALVREPALV